LEKFSELIKRRRLEKNLTMRALEAKLKEAGVDNISRSYINLLEKEKKSPTYDVAKALATILDIEIVEAMRAAYHARMARDKQRERRYLESFIKNSGLSDLDIDELIK